MGGVPDVPLGVDPDVEFPQVEVALEPGDVVALFTDGLTEAQNPAGDFYQPRRLADTLRRAPGDVTGAAQAVLDDLDHFVAGGQPGDDLTLICLGRDADGADAES